MDERKSRWELFLEGEKDVAPKEKQCLKCKKIKLLTDFYKGNCKYGRQSRCKECVSRRKYRNRADRFWKFFHAHTVRVGECLEWTAKCFNTGYAQYRWQYKEELVHRLVYRLSIGEIPDGSVVLHACNNKRCVRQSHLKLGTQTDLYAKLHNSVPTGDRNPARLYPERMARLGEKNSRAKLTENDVRSICVEYAQGKVSYRALANRYGVHHTVILDAVKRKTWKHID